MYKRNSREEYKEVNESKEKSDQGSCGYRKEEMGPL